MGAVKEEVIDIFGGAKPKAPAAKKTDKTEVRIKGLEKKLLEMQFLKGEIANLEAQLTGVTDEIRTIGKEQFLELYKANKTNPNTFLIKDGEGCVMVLPTDKYISIKDEERADQLIAEYGKDVITKDEKFYFSPEVLERNRKAIQKLIVEAKDITDDDKRNLLVKEVKYSITKGMIDRFYEYQDRMEAICDDVQPIITLKNCGGKMAEGGVMGDDFIATVYSEGGDMEDTKYGVYALGTGRWQIGYKDAQGKMQYFGSFGYQEAEYDAAHRNMFVGEHAYYGKGGGVGKNNKNLTPEAMDIIVNIQAMRKKIFTTYNEFEDFRNLQWMSVNELREIQDVLIPEYNKAVVSGVKFKTGGGVNDSKRERVIDYLINNEDDEALIKLMQVNEFPELIDITKLWLSKKNEPRYYQKIYNAISGQLSKPDIDRKFEELGLETFKTGGQLGLVDANSRGGVPDKEVDEKTYESMLGAVPPIYLKTIDGEPYKSAFAVGEPYGNVWVAHPTEKEKFIAPFTYRAYYIKDGKYFEVSEVYMLKKGEAIRVKADDRTFKNGGDVGEEFTAHEEFDSAESTHFSKVASIKGGIKNYAVDVDLKNGEQLRGKNLEYLNLGDAEYLYNTILKKGEYQHQPIDNIQLIVNFNNGEYLSIISSNLPSQPFKTGGEIQEQEIDTERFKKLLGHNPEYPYQSYKGHKYYKKRFSQNYVLVN